MRSTSNPTHRIVRFDTGRLDFQGWAKCALDVDSLEELHRRSDLQDLPVYEAMARCVAQLTQAYEACEPLLRNLFSDIVEREVGVRHGVFQTPPTFRVHLAGCPTISNFHRDIDYGMGKECLTVWLPLTRSWDSNSLWIENSGDCRKMLPLRLAYGEFAIVDTANNFHGSIMNKTDNTRISLDSRFIPKTFL